MIRKVIVQYNIKIPGLGVTVPRTDQVTLEPGHTYDEDIPARLAVNLWGYEVLADQVTVESVRPSMTKGPYLKRHTPPRNVSEITLRDRRNQGNNFRRGDWLELESTNSLATLALAFSWQTKALPAEPSDSFGPLSDTFAHLPRIV